MVHLLVAISIQRAAHMPCLSSRHCAFLSRAIKPDNKDPLCTQGGLSCGYEGPSVRVAVCLEFVEQGVSFASCALAPTACGITVHYPSRRSRNFHEM